MGLMDNVFYNRPCVPPPPICGCGLPAGLQHLVECVVDGESVKRFHLCTLCQITLRGHAIINHVISFDHVYRYIVSEPTVDLYSWY